MTNNDPCMQKRVGVEASEASHRKIPMPKFVIERQYLLPIYQRLIIDAPDITTACKEAVENDDWETAEEDGDGSGATTISALARSLKGSSSK